MIASKVGCTHLDHPTAGPLRAISPSRHFSSERDRDSTQKALVAPHQPLRLASDRFNVIIIIQEGACSCGN